MARFQLAHLARHVGHVEDRLVFRVLDLDHEQIATKHQVDLAGLLDDFSEHDLQCDGLVANIEWIDILSFRFSLL